MWLRVEGPSTGNSASITRMDKGPDDGDQQGVLRARAEIRFEADGKRFLLVHGSPRRMNEYLFEDRPLSSFQRLAQASDADVIAFGHTHMPYAKPVDSVLFVNVGIVGKPTDEDVRGLLRHP